MGWRISWVGFKGMDKAAVLTQLRFRDTGMADDANEAPFSLAEIPTGWTILFANDFDFGSAEHLIALSSAGTVVACQVHEGIMFSSAYSYMRGQELWGVWHNGGEKGVYDLTTQGALPPQFASIRQRLFAVQASADATPLSGQPQPVGNADGNATGTPLAPTNIPGDNVFDVPVELAASLTGYRHDMGKFPWGTPRFTAVERLSI